MRPDTVTPSAAVPLATPGRLGVAFVVLFAAYQAPEGVGMRLLQSAAVGALLMTAFHAVAWGVGRALGWREGFTAYGLGLAPGWGRALGVGLGGMLALKAGSVAVGGALGWLTVERVQAPPSGTALLVGLVGAAVTTLVPSVAEDIVARGFLLRAWPLVRGPAYVVTCAVLFVLTHVYRLGDGPLTWGMLFCTGLAFAAAAWRTGSLWGAVGLHWGWNLSQAALALRVDWTPTSAWAQPVLSALTGLVALGLVALLPRVQPERDARA